MTTSNLMSLPVDIPWKRLATSRDMLYVPYADNDYPPKWRSSVAIFIHEPPKEEQIYDDRIVTFLKISCSITGYQGTSKLDEIRMPIEDLRRSTWPTKRIVDRERYHPCYGAILQVAVFPKNAKGKTDSITDYPWIVDFEPKKRELYEAATDAKQFLSQSRSTISTKKSNTTTDTSEISGGILGELPVFGGFMQGSLSAKTGTAAETVDVLSADHSRERRENYSYTTNLSHMYHLLNSYHIGTNRAMFFVQPRPHIVDQNSTFVEGPRQLEGIQEFFLIVERPPMLEDICVEATLETAHLETLWNWQPRLIGRSDLFAGDNAKKTPEALGLRSSDRNLSFETFIYGSDIWSAVPDKQILANIPFNSVDAVDKIRFKEWIEGGGKGDFWPTHYGLTLLFAWKQNPDLNPLEAADVIYERVLQFTGTMFLTGRMSTNCYVDQADETLTYDDDIDIEQNRKEWGGGGKPRNMDARDANRLLEAVAYKCVSSSSSPKRLKYGAASIDEARFVQEPLVELITSLSENDPYNIPLKDIKSLDSRIVARLEKEFGVTRRKEVLQISNSLLGRRLVLTEIDVRRLKSKVIGEGPDLEKSRAFAPCPSVIGLSLADARRVLQDHQFTRIEKPVYQHRSEKLDTVVDQYPKPGESVERHCSIGLVVSTGATEVPDVVGMLEDEARKSLSDSGFQTVISEVITNGESGGRVVATTPLPGEKVISITEVILRLSTK